MAGQVTVLDGDCREAMRSLGEASIDAIITDPPYELGFMGKKWDASGVAYDVTVWEQALRVLKPGGHLLAFGGTRTYHRMTVAIEDAGFEIRDCLQWLYGSGFPKSLNVGNTTGCDEWDGWGTALKPANEPIVLARKPLVGTVAENVLQHGVGGLNINGCRIGTEVLPEQRAGEAKLGTFDRTDMVTPERVGRWPSNVLLDEAAAEHLDQQEPEVSRFFYVAKPAKAERNNGATNQHPTVKPVTLMQYLIRLVTPPGGIILDPFAGSGTTGVAALHEDVECILIEANPDYIPIIEGRINIPVQGRMV